MIAKKQNMIYYEYLKHVDELIDVEKELMQKPKPELDPETGDFYANADKPDISKILLYMSYLSAMKDDTPNFEKYENAAVSYSKFKAEVDKKVDKINKEITDYLF